MNDCIDADVMPNTIARGTLLEQVSWGCLNTHTKLIVKDNKLNEISLLTIGEVVVSNALHGCVSLVDMIVLAVGNEVMTRKCWSKKINNVLRKVKLDMRYIKKFTTSSVERYLRTHINEVPSKLVKCVIEVHQADLNSKSIGADQELDAESDDLKNTNGLKIGSVVSILVDTSKGERGIRSVGVSKAEVVAILADSDTCLVVPRDGINRAVAREVRMSLLTPGYSDLNNSLDQQIDRSSFSSVCEKKKKRILSDQQLSISEKELKKVKKDLNNTGKSKNKLIKELEEKVLQLMKDQIKADIKHRLQQERLKETHNTKIAAEKTRHEKLTLDFDNQLNFYKSIVDCKAAHVIELEKRNVLRAESATIAMKKKVDAVEDKFQKEKARSDAIFRGDRNDPSLTRAGRELVDKLRLEGKEELDALINSLRESRQNEAKAQNRIEELTQKLKAAKQETKKEKSNAEKSEARAIKLGDGTIFEKQSFDKLPPFFQELKLQLENMESKCSALEEEVNILSAQVDQSCSNELLLSVQRKPNEVWSQFTIELAMQLSALGLKPRHCSEVLKTFMSILYPKLEEGKDYHLPHEARFREWRRWIYPVLHHWSVILLLSAETMTVMHDASSKFANYHRRSILAAGMHAVFPGGLKTVVPLTMSHLTEGTASNEAKLLVDAMSSPLDGGVKLHALSTIAGISDAAAKATSKEFARMRDLEVDLVLQLVEEHGEDIDSCPEESRSLLQAYWNLPEAVRTEIRGFGIYRCLSHRINLVAEHSHKDTESATILKIIELAGGNVEKMIDVANLIRVMDKLFATGGIGGDNYLNESAAFDSYVRKLEEDEKSHNEAEGISDLFVSGVYRLINWQGSRQNYGNQVASDILIQLTRYLGYLNDRIGPNSNELLKTAWYGLSDSYAICCLCQRSFFWCCFLAPMILFTRSYGLDRSIIGIILRCARDWLQSIGFLSPDCTVEQAPQVQDLAKSIVAAVPQLAHMYEKWWEEKGERLTQDYAIATDIKYWKNVVALLIACSDPVLATFDRNNDDNDNGSNIEIHKDVILVTDPIESQFAAFEHSARGGSCFGSVRGNVIAKLTGALESDSQRKSQAVKWVKDNLKKGSLTGNFDTLVARKLAELNLQNYWNCDKEKRKAVLDEVRANHKNYCAKDREDHKDEKDAKNRRNQELVQKEIKACQRKYNAYMICADIVVIETQHALDDIIRDYNQEGLYGEFCEMIRDQIRLRIAVYGFKPTDFPTIGKGSGLDERIRLIQAMRDKVLPRPLPPRLPIPSPIPERTPHAAPTEEAAALYAAYVSKSASALTSLLSQSNHGVTFSAARLKRNERAVTAAHVAMQGVEFEEDDVLWKVIDVRYDKEFKTMVVWYYDVELADELDLDEEKMIESRNSNNSASCEPLQRSSVEEVNAWIAASSTRNNPQIVEIGNNDQVMQENDGDESDNDDVDDDDEEDEFHMDESDDERDFGDDIEAEIEQDDDL